MNIGADLPFRDYYGTVAGASARIADIVESANAYYEQFCKTISGTCMMHVEICCQIRP